MQRAWLIAALTTVGVLGAVPMSASAIPNNTYDVAVGGSGTACTLAAPCKLTTAVSDANSTAGSTIVVASGTYNNVTITLSAAVTLEAADGLASPPTFNGDGSDDAITVTATTGTVQIDGLAVSGGQDGLVVDPGGTAIVHDSSFDNSTYVGVLDYGDAMNLFNVTADDNATDGIQVSGVGADITDSTVYGNSQDGFGVVSLSGNTPDASITNSTSYANSDSGVYVNAGGSAQVYASTIVDNGGNGNAGRDAGLDTSDNGTVDAGGDIVADNNSNGATNCNSTSGTPNITDEGYNISDDAVCPFTVATNSDPSDAGLDNSFGPFDNYGDGVETLPITTGSPAADLVAATPTDASNFCGLADERGLTRPALPCAAGAFDPGATPLDPTFTLTASPSSNPSLGDTITLTATVTGAVGPASGGTVEFSMGPNGGALNTIHSCNLGLTDNLPVEDGVASCSFTASTAGDYQYDALFSGSQTYNDNEANEISNYLILHPTNMTVDVTSTTQVVATVTTDQTATTSAPGSVHFLVGGLSAGDADLVQEGTSLTGIATLTLAKPLSGSTTVIAQYAGDDTADDAPNIYAPSSGSETTMNPTLVAHLSSAAKRTKYGWYDQPVKVTWTCSAGSGTLVGSCPAATSLTASKAKQKVTKTIKNSLGGTITVSSPLVNIDRVKPTITIKGVKAGKTYSAKAGMKVKPVCVAKDPLSGLAGTCKLAKVKSHKPGAFVFKLTATVTDKAGNVTTKKISWKVVDPATGLSGQHH